MQAIAVKKKNEVQHDRIKAISVIYYMLYGIEH